MMNRRRGFWLVLAFLLIVGASFLHPALRWRVFGWARGEAFYQGRPTSYWEEELRHYQMVNSWLAGDLYFFPPEPILVEAWLEKYLGVHLERKDDPLSDPAAVPVLMELLACEDRQVRLFAIQTLGLIGPEASAAWPTLREVRRTTQEFLVFSEADFALWLIDPKAAEEVKLDRLDVDQLKKQYKPWLSPWVSEPDDS